MITRTKITQLEKKYKRQTGEDRKIIVSCDVTEDGRLLDDDGYVMTAEEIRQFKVKCREEGVGTIVCCRSYEEPKLKTSSSTTPFMES